MRTARSRTSGENLGGFGIVAPVSQKVEPPRYPERFNQMLGRPIINVTDEGHIITKNPLLSPYVVKITKMWRKLGAWFWLATQNMDDLPKAAEPMLNMIEWWICLNMPPMKSRKLRGFVSSMTHRKSSCFQHVRSPGSLPKA
ncbi:Conjugative transfer ATPase, family [Pseudomonas cichorii]|nr:Conjugative transfer ATPase, family [Pseudomonas cichorii]